mmetsp:Transcript_2921/g.8020  ORF Transcript_2921/g.8020 Transcript_2921/m.8020 type:complete len:470 (-) Transcript_2921:432-1841(-)
MLWQAAVNDRGDLTAELLKEVRASSVLTQWLSGTAVAPRTCYTIEDGVPVMEAVYLGDCAVAPAAQRSGDFAKEAITLLTQHGVPCACTDDGWMLCLHVTLEYDWVLTQLGARPGPGESAPRVALSRSITSMVGAPKTVILHRLASNQIVLEVHLMLPDGSTLEDRTLYDVSSAGDETHYDGLSRVSLVSRMVQRRVPLCMFCRLRGARVCICPPVMAKRSVEEASGTGNNVENTQTLSMDLKECWSRFSCFLHHLTELVAPCSLEFFKGRSTLSESLHESNVTSDHSELSLRRAAIHAFSVKTEAMMSFKVLPRASNSVSKLFFLHAERLVPSRARQIVLTRASVGRKRSNASLMDTKCESLRRRGRAQQTNSAGRVCELCGAQFKHGGHLNEHHRIVHLKERNFECLHCGRRFSTKSNCRKHVQLQHELAGSEPAEKCHICDRAFKCKYKLRRHIHAVHREVCTVGE